MIVLDVNVLAAAHVVDHVHHDSALRFLTAALTNDTVLAPDSVWMGFLRVVTSRRIFVRPSTAAAAADFAPAVVAAPGYRHLGGLVDGIEPLLDLVVGGQAAAAPGPAANRP